MYNSDYNKENNQNSLRSSTLHVTIERSTSCPSIHLCVFQKVTSTIRAVHCMAAPIKEVKKNAITLEESTLSKIC